VQHSAYFKDFPSGVPDTVEFWMGCLREAMLDPVAAEHVEGIVVQTAAGPRIGLLNLLSLPSYGRYQHTYQDLLAAHNELVPAAGDRVTVLHLGAAVEEELQSLYLDLAGSRVPLSDADRSGLGLLAARCAAGPQPETIPVRENRAVINGVRLAGGQPLLADTVTDVLRLASAVSDGDVSLEVPTRLRSFSRKERRVLLAALDAVVAGNRAKLGDVAQYAERWKRLGERLHPHEHPQWPGAQDVFAVARGEIRVPSFGSRVGAAMRSGDVTGAAALLAHAPGRLMRSVDWRAAAHPQGSRWYGSSRQRPWGSFLLTLDRECCPSGGKRPVNLASPLSSAAAVTVCRFRSAPEVLVEERDDAAAGVSCRWLVVGAARQAG